MPDIDDFESEFGADLWVGFLGDTDVLTIKDSKRTEIATSISAVIGEIEIVSDLGDIGGADQYQKVERVSVYVPAATLVELEVVVQWADGTAMTWADGLEVLWTAGDTDGTTRLGLDFTIEILKGIPLGSWSVEQLRATTAAMVQFDCTRKHVMATTRRGSGR